MVVSGRGGGSGAVDPDNTEAGVVFSGGWLAGRIGGVDEDKSCCN